MADRDRFLDEETPDQQEEVESGKKIGFLPVILLKVLKWVAIILAILLVIVVVTVITVRLLVGEQMAYTGAAPISEEIKPVAENLSYFTNLGQIRGQTSDIPPASFVAEVALGYEMGNNAVAAEITARSTRIYNIILVYLSKKTANDLHPKNAEKLQEELLREINRVMSSGKIKVVLFKELTSISS